MNSPLIKQWSLSHKAREMLKNNKHHRLFEYKMTAPQADLILNKLVKISSHVENILTSQQSLHSFYRAF